MCSEQQEWDEWVESRPPIVRSLAKTFPPTRRYLLKLDVGKQIVHIVSYNENGTITVGVIPDENPHLICVLQEPYEVFGINPDDIEEMQ